MISLSELLLDQRNNFSNYNLSCSQSSWFKRKLSMLLIYGRFYFIIEKADEFITFPERICESNVTNYQKKFLMGFHYVGKNLFFK